MTTVLQENATTRKGEFVCVVCPNGCLIEAEFSTVRPFQLLELSGNRCERGKSWVQQELENPLRTIATSVPVKNGDFLTASVRTKKPIPLEKVPAVMDELRKMTLKAPVHIGQSILKNPAGTDTEVVATREVQEK